LFSVGWIRIRIDIGQLDPDPSGQNDPQKKKKVDKCMYVNVWIKVLDVLFCLEAFSVVWTSFMEA
jgi:hypothetical protein